jgi:RES domain-containing protein
MSSWRRGHDDRLLDDLGKLEGSVFEGSVWRVVREGRSAIDGSRGGGRWNPTRLSVLYTALEADGAVAEMHFHINRGQSVFPSRMRHVLHELRVTTEETLRFADLAALGRLGVEERRYGEMLYDRTQEIADAAAFLGFDGIIAPSARFDGNILVLFLDCMNLDDIELVGETPVHWGAWRGQRR